MKIQDVKGTKLPGLSFQRASGQRGNERAANSSTKKENSNSFAWDYPSKGGLCDHNVRIRGIGGKV